MTKDELKLATLFLLIVFWAGVVFGGCVTRLPAVIR